MIIMKIDKNDERFVTGEDTYFGSICLICQNITNKKKRLCKAFPDGIPLEIYKGEFLHTKYYEGDNGIKFKPIKEYGSSKINKEIKKSKSKYPTFKEEYSK
jgi:hypothetical protein